MIRPCGDADFDAILAVINDGARAYAGAVPVPLLHEPYMPEDELRAELAAGVAFWGWDEGQGLVGVMGQQQVQDVTLIRHAYVRTDQRRRGIGGRLLARLCAGTALPILVGTWADATWAVGFYERHGFRLVPAEEKDGLLMRYWTVPQAQREASLVLADGRWFSRGQPE